MKVLICGGREWKDKEAIRREVEKLHLDENDTIIEGDARGADRLAGDVAIELGIALEVYPANWNRYGRSAGTLRNQQMLDQNPDLVLAFHANIESSKGTRDMVRRARKKGTAVEVFQVLKF